MAIRADFANFVRAHPVISVVSLFSIPAVFAFAGKVVSWIRQLKGTEKNVNTAYIERMDFRDNPAEPKRLDGRVQKVEIHADGNSLYATVASLYFRDPGEADNVRLKALEKEAEIINKFNEFDAEKVDQTREDLVGLTKWYQQRLAEPLSEDERLQTEASLRDVASKLEIIDAYKAIISPFEAQKRDALGKLNANYRQLRAEYDAGKLTRPEYKKALRENREKRREIQQNQFDQQAYLIRGARADMPGKTAEIIALAMAYPVTIHVYTRDEQGKLVAPEKPYGNGPLRINLVQEGGAYSPLQPEA